MNTNLQHTICLEADVTENLQGERLDKALAILFSEYSRSRLKEWLEAGLVQVNSITIQKPRQKVQQADHIIIKATLEVEHNFAPENIPLDIIYEDAEIIVINKPAGLVVHPGAGNKTGTLLNALLYFDPNLQQIPRAGIVHRLDKNTTGLMVVARTLTAHTALIQQLQSRTVKREYEAVVYGELVAGCTINAAIGRHPRDRIKMAVVFEGKEAITHIRVLEKFPDFTRIKAMLDTGRTHQIRVHMAHKHHPLVGDKTYSGRLNLPRNIKFGRQALHAACLALQHPLRDRKSVV